jgi:hypothetical protein
MAITKVTTPVTGFESPVDIGLKIPVGTNSNVPTGVEGMIRNDTDENSGGANSTTAITYYNGSSWEKFTSTESPDVTPLVINYLVVAGGGAGQGRRGGGGGAGGLLATTTYGGSNNAFTLSPSYYTFTVQVGSGGIGVLGSSGSFGASGNNSSFNDGNSNTAFGWGGGGGGASTLVGQPGGSGGGGGNGGSSYSNQGGAVYDANAECSPGGRSPTFADAGGGGGATGPTPAGFFNLGATGLTTDITGTNVTYGVGGRGGYNAQGYGNGVNAAANTGSGGSGMFDGFTVGGNTAGSGGNGVVIFRYPNNFTASSTLTYTDSPLSGTNDRVIIITGVGSGTITFT